MRYSTLPQSSLLKRRIFAWAQSSETSLFSDSQKIIDSLFSRLSPLSAFAKNQIQKIVEALSTLSFGSSAALTQQV